MKQWMFCFLPNLAVDTVECFDLFWDLELLSWRWKWLLMKVCDAWFVSVFMFRSPSGIWDISSSLSIIQATSKSGSRPRYVWFSHPNNSPQSSIVNGCSPMFTLYAGKSKVSTKTVKLMPPFGTFHIAMENDPFITNIGLPSTLQMVIFHTSVKLSEGILNTQYGHQRLYQSSRMVWLVASH